MFASHMQNYIFTPHAGMRINFSHLINFLLRMRVYVSIYGTVAQRAIQRETPSAE